MSGGEQVIYYGTPMERRMRGDYHTWGPRQCVSTPGEQSFVSFRGDSGARDSSFHILGRATSLPPLAQSLWILSSSCFPYELCAQELSKFAIWLLFILCDELWSALLFRLCAEIYHSHSSL
jgi:hypothetical protein